MSSELEKRRQEAVVAQFDVTPRHFPGRTKKIREKSWCNWHLGRDLDPGLPDYEAGVRPFDHDGRSNRQLMLGEK